MKKQSILNLVKFYVEKNDSAFRNEVAEIAQDFESNGENEISEYLMDMISTTNFYAPQNNYKDLTFLKKIYYSNKALFLPESIKDDILVSDLLFSSFNLLSNLFFSFSNKSFN